MGALGKSKHLYICAHRYVCMWQTEVFVISEKFAQLLLLSLLWRLLLLLPLLLLLGSSRPGKECGQLVKCYDKWVESKPFCVRHVVLSSLGKRQRTTWLWHGGSEALKQQRQQHEVKELNNAKRNVCVVIVAVNSMQVINSQTKYTNTHTIA